MSFSSSSSSTPSASLIAFYAGSGGDHRGRTLDDILKWGVEKLELSHDYIQTLFPLPEESGVQWNAPVIDQEVFTAFRSRLELRQKLRESFVRMLWFYGFEIKDEDDEVKVVRGANYNQNSQNWDTRFDHNHLRITRIIRCLRVLGLPTEAVAFYEALEEATTRVSSKSREFWRRAAERDLNLRPDWETNDETDNSVGKKFLRDFEVKRKQEDVQKKKATGAEAASGLIVDSGAATKEQETAEIELVADGSEKDRTMRGVDTATE